MTADSNNKLFWAARRGYRQGGGFTLMELLVVIAIIALLVAIGLGVGSKMMSAAAKKKTVGYMKIVMLAVNTYKEEVGFLPYADETGTGTTEFNGTDLFTALRYGGNKSSTTIEPAYVDTWDNKIKPIIDKLPDDAFEKDGDGKAIGFQDGFSELLRFEPADGLGGTPRLVSSGPDKKFGANESSDEAKDNIYSDR